MRQQSHNNQPEQSNGSKASRVLAVCTAASAALSIPVVADDALNVLPTQIIALADATSFIALAFSIAAIATTVISAATLVLIWMLDKRGQRVHARRITRMVIVTLIISMMMMVSTSGLCWSLVTPLIQLVFVISYQVINDPLLTASRRVANPLTWWRNRQVEYKWRNQRHRKQNHDNTGDTVETTRNSSVADPNVHTATGETIISNADSATDDGRPNRLRTRISACISGDAYIPLNFFNLFWIFVVTSILGLAIEMLFCLIANGVWESRVGLLFGPFSPIYGVGAVIMTVALNRFWDKSTIIIFVVSAIVGATVEWCTSYYMEVAFGVSAWDYSGSIGSIGGRTDLAHAIAWGLLGLMWIRIMLPGVMGIIAAIPLHWRAAVTIVAMVLLLVDASLTIVALDCWSQRIEASVEGTEYVPTDEAEAWVAETFPDDMMEKKFSNMGFIAEKQ